MKLSTMRIIWGVIGGIMALQSLMNLAIDKPLLGFLQLVVGAWAIWYAAKPPAYVRKNFIQD